MKKNYHLVFDCETATLPFANEIANGDPERKKRIAIARPLIYDTGWTVIDRQGNIKKKRQFLISEIFSVPSVFNTAYYAEKRPLYLEMLKNKEIELVTWETFVGIFLEDASECVSIGAFNSMFDFKKAIPFTELYISKLYSPDYYKWEHSQRNLCNIIANGSSRKDDKGSTFENDVFRFRGHTFKLFDLWGLATTHLLNNATYKKMCLEHDMLTNSGLYFKTSAESTYRYLLNKYDFDEAHTALEDAIIESFILAKIAAKHAITPGIKYFPFKDLGYTDDFCARRHIPQKKEIHPVYFKMNEYLEGKEEETSPYYSMMFNKFERLETLLETAI